MLSLTNFTVTLDDKIIVDHLKLQVEPGEIHVLMGPNGAGKSSLAQALMGNPRYLVAKGSKFTLNRRNLIPLSPDKRAQAGLFLAFQNPVSIQGISVQNFLKTAYEAIHCADCQSHNHCPRLSVSQFRSELNALAQSLDIPQQFLNRSINDDFSGGEKKRLEILQLLILKPQFALLDEPDSGLDIDSLTTVAKGITRAVAEFKTGIVLITHYRRLLDYLNPTKVSVLIKGRLAKTGGSEIIQQLETKGYHAYA